MRSSLIGWPLMLVCLVALSCFVALSVGCNSKPASELAKSDSASEPVGETPEEIASEEVKQEELPEESAELSLSEALEHVTDGKAVLVDVRSDKEWNESHFAQAQHISIDKINEDAAAACSGLNKDQIVLLHWGSGGRAGRAAKTLEELGFKVQALKTKYAKIKEAGFKEAE